MRQIENEGCGCVEYEDSHDFLESRLMRMTFWAHKAVLFDKIKQKIEEQEGEKLDKIADLLVQASKEKWETEQETDKKRDEFSKKLKENFEG